MKALGVVFIIIGIVAVIGAVLFMVALITVGAALATLQPPEGADISSFTSQLQTLLTLGWAWSIASFLAGLIAIRAGWPRKK